ncbi:hypothetical protein [Nesterenkonia aerolata]|uniref:Uncharacterized protein n=1 Tax=Nesterenkonia aerolata TaxID=3074079 RepID=A0ABU2DS66_9MICC|nr:hypothetical protein [Nesterenkonia sp. LY-0111]MDR8019215.1 hypothetical protein [Nesterenkonia sp. LY-0111]
MALTSTWETIEVPVLEATVSLLESKNPGSPTTLDEIVEASGLERDEVNRTIGKLSQEHLVANDISAAGAGAIDWIVKGVTPKGLRAAGVWPSENAAAGAFLEALDQQIEEAPEGSSKKSALEQIKASAKNVTEGTLTAVFAAAVKAGTGL